MSGNPRSVPKGTQSQRAPSSSQSKASAGTSQPSSNARPEPDQSSHNSGSVKHSEGSINWSTRVVPRGEADSPDAGSKPSEQEINAMVDSALTTLKGIENMDGDEAGLKNVLNKFGYKGMESFKEMIEDMRLLEEGGPASAKDIFQSLPGLKDCVAGNGLLSLNSEMMQGELQKKAQDPFGRAAREQNLARLRSLSASPPKQPPEFDAQQQAFLKYTVLTIGTAQLSHVMAGANLLSMDFDDNDPEETTQTMAGKGLGEASNRLQFACQSMVLAESVMRYDEYYHITIRDHAHQAFQDEWNKIQDGGYPISVRPPKNFLSSLNPTLEGRPPSKAEMVILWSARQALASMYLESRGQENSKLKAAIDDQIQQLLHEFSQNPTIKRYDAINPNRNVGKLAQDDAGKAVKIAGAKELVWTEPWQMLLN